jgi:hypothetical protein
MNDTQQDVTFYKIELYKNRMAVNLPYLVQKRDPNLAVVNTVMNLRFP